jgi:hypothetical protein
LLLLYLSGCQLLLIVATPLIEGSYGSCLSIDSIRCDILSYILSVPSPQCRQS